MSSAAHPAVLRCALLLAGLLAAVALFPAAASAVTIPPNFQTVVDQDPITPQPNDVNQGQTDLTQFGRDDTDPLRYKLLWSWDSTSAFTGGNEGTACALFDTNDNGNIDFAVCAEVGVVAPGDVRETIDSPVANTCNDSKPDRCAGPTPQLIAGPVDVDSGSINPYSDLGPLNDNNLVTDTDPFPNQNADQNHPNDTTIAMFVRKGFLPLGADLVNVCSYSSIGTGGNADPKDCIVRPGDGFLIIRKQVPNPPGPSTINQSFTFTASPGGAQRTITFPQATQPAAAQPIGMLPSNAVSISEAIPQHWNLTAVSCVLDDGVTPTGTGPAGLPVGGAANAGPSGITVQSGQDTTCTFSDAPKAPALTLQKNNDANGDGTFTDTESVPSAGAHTITYELVISNPAGSPPATIGQILDDKVNPPLETSQPGKLDCKDVLNTVIQPNASVTCYFDGAIGAAQAQLVNEATVVATHQGSQQSVDDTSTVNQPGSIEITKTAGAASVSAGDPISFTITVENEGPGTANNVQVSDTLPGGTGVDWSTTNPDCSISGSPEVLTCDFGSVLPGAANAESVTVTSQTTKDSCKTYSNTASVTTSGSGGATSLPAQVVVNCPDVVITKTANPAGPVSAGDDIGFDITVTNNGDGVARNVTVTDNLPTDAGLDWSESSADCAIAGTNPEVLTCSFGDLAKNATRTVTVTSDTTPASCGTIQNTASVTVGSPAGSPLASQPASVKVDCPDVVIAKTANPAGPVSAGDDIGFDITVTNNGDGVARNVTVTDNLPNTAGLDWSESSADCAIAGTNPEVLTCSFGDLAKNATRTVTVTSDTTPASCATIQNTASVSIGNQANSPLASQPASVRVDCPNVVITKTANPVGPVSAGDDIGFDITVTNNGDGVARNVTVTDNLPNAAGLDWSESSADCAIAGTNPEVLTCSLGDLAKNASRTVTVTSGTTPASCSTIDNTATVELTNGPGDSDDASVVVNCGAVDITKTADAASVDAGDAIGFTISVDNTGTGQLRGVVVEDVLPTQAGLSWSIDPADPDCSIAAGKLTCNFGTIDANDPPKTVHITSPTTAASCATIDNTASVTTGNDGTDTDDASTTVKCGAIDVEKVADAASVTSGQPIGFTITATNNGAGEARGVTVTDNLPTGNGLAWTVSPADQACAIANGTLTCTFGTLAAGASRSVHVSSPTTATTCGRIDNTATVTTTNDGTDSDEATTEVFCSGIRLVKDGPDLAHHGDPLQFTFAVSNSDTSPLHDVVVTDDKCAAVGATPALKHNDDGDGLLERVGADGANPEQWVFACRYNAPAQHAANEANPIRNVATVTARDPRNASVTATDDHTTRLVHPAVNIEKTGPATADAGDRVPYVLTVTNPGDIAIVGQTLSVTDPQCDAPPLLRDKLRNGAADATPDTLDPGDTWTYTCSVPTEEADEELINVATVEGTDTIGGQVSDSDDATTVLEAGEVLPENVKSGRARLTGPTSCVKSSFPVRIRGRNIRSVKIRIDGRTVKTFRAASGKGRKFVYRVRVNRFDDSLHKLRARVTFLKDSETRPRTLRMVFQRCSRQVIVPQFTG